MRRKNQKSFYKRVIAIYLLIALLAPLLANEKPLYMVINGNKYFPAFNNDSYINLTGENQLVNTINWKHLPADFVIFAPVRWSPGRSDLLNSFVSPFGKQFYDSNGQINNLPTAERHYLGTGKLGNDTLAELIHGTRVSVLIGTLSMLIASFIGILLGIIAGYFGDYSIRIFRLQVIIAFMLIVPAWFYGFTLRTNILTESFQTSYITGIMHLSLSIIIFCTVISLPFLIKLRVADNKKIFLPIDSIISRLIETFVAIPRLILILTIAAILPPSVAIVIMLIGLTAWTEIARVVRSQVLQIRKQNYIESARSTGMNTIQIITRHILPNIKDQVLSIAVFGVAATILIETGLSFLGVGVPAGTPTWGQVMFEARQHYTAWWLVLFSGMAISGLLYSLYLFSQNELLKKRN